MGDKCGVMEMQLRQRTKGVREGGEEKIGRYLQRGVVIRIRQTTGGEAESTSCWIDNGTAGLSASFKDLAIGIRGERTRRRRLIANRRRKPKGWRLILRFNVAVGFFTMP